MAVGADGNATIQAKFTDGSVFVNLPDLDQPPITVPIADFSIRYKRSPTGNMTEIAVKGLPLPITRMLGMNSTDEWKLVSHAGVGLDFPTRNMQAGETWKNDTSLELLGQQFAIQYINTLHGPRVVDHVNYLQINSQVTVKAPALNFRIPVGNGQTVTVHEALDDRVKSSTLFDAAAGEMFSTWLDGDSNFTITAPGHGTDQTSTTTGTWHISGGISKIKPYKPLQ